MKLLVIEDDHELAAFIQRGMEDAGHSVTCVHDGAEGLSLAQGGGHDVLVVDRMLPGLEGLEIIKALRGSGDDVPVIILSALGEVDDRVKGLRSGGDDYLTKPFAFDELLARVEILFSRITADNNEQETVLEVGDLKMDLIARTVVRGDVKIDLLAREFKLLEYLIRHKAQVVTRTMLLENVWDYNFDPQTNLIDVHISRLRGKVDKGFDTALIQTKRGAGYIIGEGL